MRVVLGVFMQDVRNAHLVASGGEMRCDLLVDIVDMLFFIRFALCL